jgi:hypothetical protein
VSFRRFAIAAVAMLALALTPAFAQHPTPPPAPGVPPPPPSLSETFRGRSWGDLWRAEYARVSAARHNESAAIHGRVAGAAASVHHDGGPLGTETYSPYFSGTDTSLGFPDAFSLYAGAKRESNCSLTELIGGFNQNGQYAIFQSITSFEKYLHTISGLTTTVDKFPNGCNDPIASGEQYRGVALGQIKNGNYAGASYSYTYDDAVYVGVFSESNGVYTNVSNSDYRVGYNVSGIVAADFNGDGYNDMAVLDTSDTGGTSPQISILIANGDGTYKSPVQIPAGIAIFGIVTGDFNGDKKQDIVASAEKSSGDYELLFFAGNGDGTFKSPVATDTGATERLVAQPDDVNGDGKLDIIAWDISSTAEPRVATLDALINNGSASFTPTLSVTAPNFFPVYAEDINNDGKDDLIYTDTLNNTLVVLQGDGAGHFTYKATYPTVFFPDSSYVSDYDGDGNPDLLVGVGGLYGAAPVSQGAGEILLGNGDFTFSTPASPQPIASNVTFSSGGPQSFAVADLNGDGKQDLAVVGHTSATPSSIAVTTFLNSYAANLGNGTTVNFTLASGNGYGIVLAAPLSGSSPNSLVVVGNDSSNSSPAIQAAINNGSGSFTVKSTVLDLPAPVSSIVSADFNGDGKSDLAFILDDSNSDSADALYTARGNGDGTFQAPVILDSAINDGGHVFSADVNGDGKPDLIAIQATSGYSYVRVYLNQGTSFAAPVTFSTPDGATLTWVMPADFNGDGKLDLGLIGYSASGGPFDANLYVFTGNKTANFTYASTSPLGSGGAATGVAIDMNHDGILDVVVDGCCGAANPAAILGKGGNAFYPPQTFVVPQSAFGVQAINLNADAYPDLVFSLYDYSAAVIAPLINHYGNAPSTSKAATVITAPTSTTAIQSYNLSLYASVAETSAAGQPSGTVTLSYGSNVLQTQTLSGGEVYFYLPTTGLAAGKTYNLTLAYSGDNFNAPSTASISVLVQYLTDCTLTITPAAIDYDGTVTLTTKVTRPLSSGTPTGNVLIFYNSGNTVLTSLPLVNGVATLTTSVKGYPAGQYVLSALYEGDSDGGFGAVDADSSSPYVNTSIAPKGLTATTTNLTLNPDPITYGQKATLTAAVAPGTGSSVPAGTVTFYAEFYGTTYNLGTVPLNNKGVATAAANTAGFGYYGFFALHAVYNGNSTTYTSTSQTLSIYLRPVSYVYFPQNTYTVTAGQSVTLTAEVPQVTYYPVNGTLTFSAEGVKLATVPVANNQASFTASTAGLAKGTYTVTATYNGDSYNGTGSATATVTLQ